MMRQTQRTVAVALFVIPLMSYVIGSTAYAADDSAGEVVFVKGIATAQLKDDAPRVIGKGDQLQQGEKLDTGGKSFALIRLRDGTQMTLRPDTAMVLNKVVTKKGKESGVLSLLKGGLRAVTGFIGKRKPGNFRIKTPTATIGIRGTDFDARLCDTNCDEEGKTQKNAGKKRAITPSKVSSVVARAAILRGIVTVKAEGKPDRLLTKGGPVYEGDIVDTAVSAFVVLAFRDQTRLTVQANSSFKVASFKYSAGKVVTQQDNSVTFRLIKGGLRMLTGLVGKRNPNHVRISSAVATIGIRGTGVDVICGAGCVDTSQGTPDLEGIPAGLHTAVWDGSAFIEMPSGTYSIQNGEAFFLERGATVPVKMPVIPIFIKDNPAPRPDGVDVDFGQLFSVVTGDTSQPGLYVTVRDGHIALEYDGNILDIAGGETGYAGQGNLHRLSQTPAYILHDPYPTPLQFDENVQRIIELISDEAGGLECTL